MGQIPPEQPSSCSGLSSSPHWQGPFLPYQVLVHMLVLHPPGQVVQGFIELVLAQKDLRELSLEGWLGVQSTVPITASMLSCISHTHLKGL